MHAHDFQRYGPFWAARVRVNGRLEHFRKFIRFGTLTHLLEKFYKEALQQFIWFSNWAQYIWNWSWTVNFQGYTWILNIVTQTHTWDLSPLAVVEFFSWCHKNFRKQRKNLCSTSSWVLCTFYSTSCTISVDLGTYCEKFTHLLCHSFY